MGLLLAVVAIGQAPILPSHWGAVLPDDQALTFARARLCKQAGTVAAEFGGRSMPRVEPR
jgi:hypothetical protein